MGKNLIFRYSAMNAGKSTSLLQVAHNYEERDQRVLVMKPAVDTKGQDRVISRLGASRPVDVLIDQHMDVRQVVRQVLITGRQVDCILVDEAQFLLPNQVDGLLELAVRDNIPVIAYGIRTDFRAHAFPGSLRLLEVAHTLEELKTICRCGRKAIFNGLRINGIWVAEDNREVIIDDGSVEYEALCGFDYLEKLGHFPEARSV